MEKNIVETLKRRGFAVTEAMPIGGYWYAMVKGYGWTSVSDLLQGIRSNPIVI